MTKHQIIIVVSAIVLTGLLYFAVDSKPRKLDSMEQAAEEASGHKMEPYISKKREALKEPAHTEIEQLEKSYKQASVDSVKLELLKKLASVWYKEGEAAISGYYAEKVAELEKTAEAWQIAGTTYRSALQQSTEEEIKEISSQRAANSLEKAISLDSSNIAYRMQLAMVYVDRPLQDNPMKGILMLRELNEKYPDQPAIILQLGQLAMKTGQFDKAIERFKKAVTLLPEQTDIYCMLAEAYAGKGDKAAADAAVKKCKK